MMKTRTFRVSLVLLAALALVWNQAHAEANFQVEITYQHGNPVMERSAAGLGITGDVFLAFAPPEVRARFPNGISEEVTRRLVKEVEVFRPFSDLVVFVVQALIDSGGLDQGFQVEKFAVTASFSGREVATTEFDVGGIDWSGTKSIFFDRIRTPGKDSIDYHYELRGHTQHVEGALLRARAARAGGCQWALDPPVDFSKTHRLWKTWTVRG